MEAFPTQYLARNSPHCWASDADWHRHRLLITDLYQQMSLKRMMEIMETQHKFRATIKMYKRRISLWRLDKKNKEGDMKAIVRKRAERENEGKASIFYIRGKAVDFKDVVRYWDRKGVSIEDVMTQREGSTTPIDVKVFTPFVSRVSTPVPAPLTTPKSLALPEEMLVLLKDYVKGSFDSGTWIRSHPHDRCYSIKDRRSMLTDPDVIDLPSDALADMDIMESSLLLACSLFTEGFPHEAGVLLQYASATMEQTIRAEDPHTLIRLLSTFAHCLFRGRYEIDLAMLRHFAGIGDVWLGCRHPFPRICQWLASYDQLKMHNAFELCSWITMDTFRGILGRLHRSSLIVFECHSRVLHVNCPIPSYASLKRLLKECESNLEPQDHRNVEVHRMLMLRAISVELAEAERDAGRIGPSADVIGDGMIMSPYRIRALVADSVCQSTTRPTRLAIAALNEALEVHAKYNGLAEVYLSDLKTWQLQRGNDDAAMQARDKRLATLETPEAAVPVV